MRNKEALGRVLAAVSSDPEGDFAKRVFLEVLRSLPAVPKVPGKEVFWELGSKMVPLFLELVLVRDGQAFLTYRRDDHWDGWHFPGGSREPRTTLDSNCQRIASRELGAEIRITGAQQVGFKEHPESPRFHEAAMLVLCGFEGEPQNGEWFVEMPPNILQRQRSYWSTIAPFLR